MIQRVYEQVLKVLEHVYVATDDQRIVEEVHRFGGKALMTSDHHQSGTDRCHEAYTQLKEHFDVIINIQGDEPFIQPSQLQTLMDCYNDPQVQIATLVRTITEADGMDFLMSPNHPKVVINHQSDAIYFSRSVIPYLRNVAREDYLKCHDYYAHVGIYAYKTNVLDKLVVIPPSPLETAESLEQLRWIEHGFKIRVGFTTERSVGIDTPSDLKAVEKYLL